MSTHERFMAFLIEHYAGAFPLWLSPVQVSVLPVSSAQEEYTEQVVTTLKERGVRVELLSGNDSLGKRIREAKVKKVPYFIVIGDKEKDSGNLTLEQRSGEKLELSLEDLITKLETEIKERK